MCDVPFTSVISTFDPVIFSFVAGVIIGTPFVVFAVVARNILRDSGF